MRCFAVVLAGLVLGCGSGAKPVVSGNHGAAGTSPDASHPGDGAAGSGGGGTSPDAAAGSMAGAAGSVAGAAGPAAGAPGTDGGRADGSDAVSPDGADAAPDAGPPGKLARPSLAALRAVGGWALGAVVTDFSGDGKPDVAVANVSAASVSLLINEGGGLFAPASSYDVGGEGGGNWILASDLDGDRRPDLAVSVYNDAQDQALGTRTVVLLNADNGVFGPARKVADGEAIALSDLDGDGKGDLVVAKGGNANVLLNDGKGVTFRAAGTYALGFGINRAAVGDLNKDGTPDLVVSTYADLSMSGSVDFAGSLVVLLATGGGAFVKGKTYPIAKGASAIEIADVSGDGVPDLIASESLRVGRNAALNILVNKGDGSFADAAPLELGPIAVVATDFVARDFDRDGKVDLAVTCGENPPPRTLKIFRNLGGGSFGEPTLHSLAIDVGSLSAADLDGDGALDFVTPTGSDGHVGVLRGYADGTFPGGPAFTPSFNTSSYRGSGFAVGEMDGDGKPDLLITAASRNTVGIFRNDGNGGFSGPLEFTAPGACAVAAADLNGDGKTDFAVAASGVSVYLNKGAASFMAPTVLATRPPPAGTPEAIVAGDVNGDGAPDLITLDTPDVNDNPPIATPVSVLLNKRDGTFAAAVNYAAPSFRARAGGLALADVNGDKAADLIVATGGKAVGVLVNKGDGTFLPSVDLPATAASAVVAADLNGDGKPDLAVVDGGVVTLRLNDGKGGFGPATAPLPALTGGPAWSAVTAGDLDNDGKPDLVTLGQRVVGVALGRGDGTFAEPVLYLDGAVEPDLGVLTADFNGDGKRDVALLSVKGFSVILNDGR